MGLILVLSRPGPRPTRGASSWGAGGRSLTWLSGPLPTPGPIAPLPSVGAPPAPRPPPPAREERAKTGPGGSGLGRQLDMAGAGRAAVPAWVPCGNHAGSESARKPRLRRRSGGESPRRPARRGGGKTCCCCCFCCFLGRGAGPHQHRAVPPCRRASGRGRGADVGRHERLELGKVHHAVAVGVRQRHHPPQLPPRRRAARARRQLPGYCLRPWAMVEG
jgi:hypothetical protein